MGLEIGDMLDVQEAGRRPVVAVFTKGHLELPDGAAPDVAQNIDRLGDQAK